MWKKFDITTTSEPMGDLIIQVVRVKGYLDSSTFPQMQDHLQDLLADNQYNIVVEFGDLNYISSAGLGVLMGMLQEIRNKEGDLKLANMPPKIKNLFDMLGFSRLIRIYGTVDQAKEAFVKEKQESQSDKEQPSIEDSY